MKKAIILIIFCIMSFYGCFETYSSINSQPVRNYLVALTPYSDQLTREAQRKFILKILYEIIEPGDTLKIMDGVSQKDICEFSFSSYPRNSKLSKTVRKQAIAKKWNNLIKYYQNLPKAKIIDRQLNIPMLCRYLSSYNQILSNAEFEVVLLGSAIYNDKNKYNFNKKIPDDGLFKDSNSPFFINKTKLSSLNNIKIHWIFYKPIDSKSWDFIEAFWGVFFEKQGAQLVSFNNMFETGYSRLGKNLQSKNNYNQLVLKEKKDNTPCTKEDIASCNNNNNKSQTSPLNQNISIVIGTDKTHETILKSPNGKHSENLQIKGKDSENLQIIDISTSWELINGKADIDSYLILPENKIVSYKNRLEEYEGSEIYFTKDFLAPTIASGVKHGFENFTINNGNCSNIELWLNYYARQPSKKALTVKGQVQIRKNNNLIKSIPFELSFQSNGEDFNNRHNSKAWTQIDLSEEKKLTNLP